MSARPVKLAHLTTVDMSLRHLVLPQLQAAVAMGWDVIGISAPGEFVPELEAAGVRHVPLPTSTRGWAVRADLRAARDLWAILRRERVDVLHTHNPKPGLYGRILGRVAGVPVVVNTVHGLYATEEDPWTKRALVYLLESFAARFSDAELVQSAEDLKLMTAKRITPAHRTFLLGNGIDLGRFDPSRFSSVDREAIRDELGVSPGEVLVGTVGRLVAEKGYPELVEAASALGAGFAFVAAGPDDPQKADALGAGFRRRAEEAGVALLGMRSDVDRLYAAMDVFALPSHREGFPRSAMEAAASGLPIVATDIRGCREVVEDGVTGRLLPVRDPSALAAAIRELGDDAETRRRMGAAGRDRALERFDERRVVQTVFSTYHGVAVRKGIAAVAAAAPPIGDTVIRPAEDRDIPHLARLHMEAIETGFLPSLGSGFMERLYAALLDWEDAVVLVADGAWRPVGFVAGAADTRAFFRHFLKTRGVGAALVAARRLARPSMVRRAWETLRYPSGDEDVPAELLAMAVAPEARRRGLARRLGGRFLADVAGRGPERVKVVVGAQNAPAIAAYETMGFVPAGTVEVHAGEPSEVLVWSASR